MTHTPWTGSRDEDGEFHIRDANGGYITGLEWSGKEHDYGPFIVRAVNIHEALVSGLQRIDDIQNANSFTHEPTALEMANIARDLLAKLED